MAAQEPAASDVPATLSVDTRADARLADAGARLLALLTDAISDGYPAGATLAVTDAEGELMVMSAGWACKVGTWVTTSHLICYDLASLTKVVCTVPLAMALAQRGAWSLDEPVSHWLEGFPNPRMTLRQLLTHTSGLPPHREFYRMRGDPGAIRAAVYQEASGALEPGAVCYSDLGFMLQGWATERCGGGGLDELFDATVATPLGMDATCFRPPPANREMTAATELYGAERLRPGLVWGEVHDSNAWALGGVAGHAGLFAPAGDLVRYVRALLQPETHPVMSAESIAEMTKPQAGAPPDVRALGWRLDASEWGAWPPSTYWHTGFTGTSLLIAPELGIAVVLLMGGVHPTRRLARLDVLRASIHRLVLDALV